MVSSDNILTNQVWFDYQSQSKIITYTGTASATIQAVLPLFAAFVGSQTWSIVRLAIWHFYWRRKQSSKLKAFKGCSEQRIAIIRNSGGGLSLFCGLIRHWWQWRRWFRKMKSPYQVSFPAITLLICLLHFAGWTAGGVLVGQIWASTSSDQALLRGICGDLNLTDTMSVEQNFAYRALNNNYTVRADEYARQCYVDTVLPTSSCSYFPQRRINFTEYSAACPFQGSETCLPSAIPWVLDSQYIDSSDALGINAPVQDRVYWRRKTTCSPVTSVGRTEIVNYTKTTDKQEWPSNTTLYRFYYGSIGELNSSASYASNWTYEFSSWKPEHNLQYDISAYYYLGASPSNVWRPNNTFWDPQREDADVSLFFINGDHVVYEYPNNDPVFCTGASFVEPTDGVNITLWTPEYYTNVLACIDQYQICNSPSPSRTCSPLVGSYRLGSEVFRLGLNTEQLETAKRIVRLYPTLGTYSTVAGRGASAFQATLGLSDTTQTKQLPDDQWRIEVRQWFAVSLAKLQQRIVEYAAAPTVPEVLQSLRTPQNAAAAAQCNSQRIALPAGATNFRWLGIEVLIGFGLYLWVLGTAAEWLVDKLLMICNAEKRRMAWITTGPEGLQRMAYRAAGYGGGSWAREDKGTPVWLPQGNNEPKYVMLNGSMQLQVVRRMHSVPPAPAPPAPAPSAPAPPAPAPPAPAPPAPAPPAPAPPAPALAPAPAPSTQPAVSNNTNSSTQSATPGGGSHMAPNQRHSGTAVGTTTNTPSANPVSLAAGPPAQNPP